MNDEKDLWLRQPAERRWLEGEVARCWRGWGYREVATPAWLPWEDLAHGAAGVAERAAKFLDPEGRVVTLRPDLTVPIARLAATSLKDEPRPLRVCYLGELFRRVSGAPGGLEERPQVGLELIGNAGPGADAEVLTLALETLRALGIGEFRVAVGHVAVLRRELEAAGLDEAASGAVLQALQARDYVALDRALAAGGPGVVALRGRLLSPGPNWTGAGEELARVLELVAGRGYGDHLAYDMGLVRDLGYYTGMVFEVYSPRVARPLGGGGRYDGLVGKYGRPEPATGFAFGVDELLRELAGPGSTDRRGGRPGYLVLGLPGGEARAYERAAALRSGGEEAELEMLERPLSEALDYARQRRVATVLVVDAGGEESIPLA